MKQRIVRWWRTIRDKPGLRPFRLFVAGLFILLGIVGFVLPILQGFLFVFIGLGLLGAEFPAVKRFTSRLKEKIRSRLRWKKPKVRKRVEETERLLSESEEDKGRGD